MHYVTHMQCIHYQFDLEDHTSTVHTCNVFCLWNSIALYVTEQHHTCFYLILFYTQRLQPLKISKTVFCKYSTSSVLVSTLQDLTSQVTSLQTPSYLSNFCYNFFHLVSAQLWSCYVHSCSVVDILIRSHCLLC